MDSRIHNVCHLMNIAQCMQLPDLQYEMSLTQTFAFTHTRARSSSFKGFADLCVRFTPVHSPGGQYNTYSIRAEGQGSQTLCLTCKNGFIAASIHSDNFFFHKTNVLI